MKLAELKQRTYEAWQLYCWFKQAMRQDELFKPEIREQFGDLRKRSTWENALIRFTALNAQVGLIDAYTLITDVFNFLPERWDYSYRHRIFEQFLTLPDGLDLLRAGFEELLSQDFTDQERTDAYGFFEMVRESGRGTLGGITA